MLVCLLGAQAVHSYRADTSPLYPIADTSEFEAAVDYVNRTMPADGVAIVPKDMGFYVDGRIIEGEDHIRSRRCKARRSDPPLPAIDVFAHDPADPRSAPETEALLVRCFPERREYGIAYVLSRTPGCR